MIGNSKYTLYFCKVRKLKQFIMISKLFIRLARKSCFRRFIWKYVYQYLASKYKNAKHWTFMNYGYANEDTTLNPVLNEEDEADRYFIQLYHKVANIKNLDGCKVLEVGSGRGGGSSYVKRYLKPAEMIGLDIANSAVKFCKKRHKVEGLSFEQGNAEALPFNDESFDLVINVESSHAYGSVEKFVQEVKRVLKPEGFFSITDHREKDRFEEFKSELESSGMKIIEETNINKNVALAIEVDDNRKSEAIKEMVGENKLKLFNQFAGLKNSIIHTDVKTGERIYQHFVLQKK